MNWTEQKSTGEISNADSDRARLLEEVKKSSLPVVQKEAGGGVRPFEQIHFQPMKCTGTVEAEFGVKGEDLIFHIWPWGYHDAERKENESLPSFNNGFVALLNQAFGESFDLKRISSEYDRDIGAFFVKATGYASNQFYRDLAIKAVTALHLCMGGTL